jgi:uncharacterized protein (TIGR02246 family)
MSASWELPKRPEISMQSHELKQVIESADSAINREDFERLMDFYSDDATLVVMPEKYVTGKDQIRKAFVAITEHFNHSLEVTQGDMVVIEGEDIALVVANTHLKANTKSDSPFSMERYANYVFKKFIDGTWRCVIDNSYGAELLTYTKVPTLHLLCGKIASGKSTLARKLAAEPKTLLISEDEWLTCLYPGEIMSLKEYVHCTSRLRNAMGNHIEQILREGNSVVLDFPANTPSSRQWMQGLCENANVAHCLHYLDVSDEECKARLRLRNKDSSHGFNTGEAEYDEITRYFVPPSAEEGFNIISE